MSVDAVVIDGNASYDTDGDGADDSDIVPASTPPRLERDGVVLAKDVDDFQLAWFYDDDGNGVAGARRRPAEPRDPA